jgi:beta-glucanase (GH16 family)
MARISRRWGATLVPVLAALVAASISSGPAAQAAPTLISQGKAASASSSEGPGTAPAAAIDGNPGTRWSSSFANNQWLQVNLGAKAAITQVSIAWEAAAAKAYRVEVSDDARTWRSVYRTTAGNGGTDVLNLNTSGKYVRVFGELRTSAYGFSIWELKVLGTGGTPTPSGPRNVTFPANRLVFADEFNAPAGTAVNAAKWRTETGPGQNNELQYYTAPAAKNTFHNGLGQLVIEARKKTTPGSSCPGGPCQYTSGRINSSGKFAFTYGRVTASIKVSGTPGLWPAFWLLGSNFPTVGWPNSGEIDIMEHLGREPGLVHSSLHAPGYSGGNAFTKSYAINGDFKDAFHEYTVEWNRNQMTFYVDGKVSFTFTRAQLESTRGPWVFDHPFFLILNNAVGGDWPGPPNSSSVFPQRMVIDYVRVYQN